MNGKAVKAYRAGRSDMKCDVARLLTAEADALRASGLPNAPQHVELLTHIVNRLVKLQ